MFKPTLGLAHPASCSVDDGDFLLGVERLRCEADNSPPSRAEYKNMCFHDVYPDGITIVYFTVLNCRLLIEEGIKERIAAGNRSFFADKKIFQSELITRKTKERLYHTVIRPVVVYGSECCVLTENIKQKLLIFERRLLRRIFGPTQKTNGEWR